MTTLAGLTPDWWVAIGTIALAAVTVGAVVVSIVLARRESKRTDERIMRAEESRRWDQQLRQAWTVVVLPRNYATGPDERHLGMYVANRGDSTITGVEAKFSVGDQLYDAKQKSASLGEENDLIWDFDSRVYSAILPPRAAFVFTNETLREPSEIVGWFPIVRWRDWGGQLWENRRGVVKPVKDGARW